MVLVSISLRLLSFVLLRYNIIKKCWKEDPSERPTFEDLVTMLDIGLQEVAGYLEMEMVLVPKEGED